VISGRLASALADRYRIERELGAGGMATVYLAHDLKHDRKVAVKVLRPELAESLGHDRFLREITTTANLRHPHILPLYDSGEADGFLFYAMPYVEGESLRDRLTREKQLPLDDAVRITHEVANALEYAHARGIVHRDIKPENILLDSGHAVVADFGIARALSAAGQSTLTLPHTAIGTPTYMSPEQAAGEQLLDGRSDQYALGCVTYEMLAGQPPFTGPTVESVIHQHMIVAPRLVSQVRSSIPATIADAVHRALAKNPADRFASLGDFREALRTDVHAAEVSAVDAPKRRRRIVGSLAALVAVALVFIAWLASRDQNHNAALDPDVIAVLPFRVGGNDPTISYLRESMLDLMQARLNGGSGARTVEPRTLLAAWRRAVGNEQQDLAEKASRALAAELGAGRVLLGSVVATPSELTLHASLLRVADGVLLARESVVGAPDSVAALVNRLTAALLIRDAGEAGERRLGLASAPLDALQDYLAGRKAYRRGDYFGAMDLYRRAFERDSSFVDAAFSMVATNAWIGTVFERGGYEVIPQVWSMRGRLGKRDLGLFLSMPSVGPNYPNSSNYAETIGAAEQAASQAPDSPEHWLLLGQLLSSYGAAASQQDWLRRSADALDRAIALDSSFTVAVGARAYTAMAQRDEPAAARFANLLEQRVAAGFSDDFHLWAAARMRGDVEAALRWRDRTTGQSRKDYMQKLIKISLFGVALGLPLEDSRWAADALLREATNPDERAGALLSDLAVRFAQGRVEFGEVHAPFGPGWAATLIQQALIDTVYRSIGAAVIAREASGGYRAPSAMGEVRWPPVQLCLAQLFRIAAGDTSGTAAAIRGLRMFATDGSPQVSRSELVGLELNVCPLLLSVLTERAPARDGARWVHLDELDSLMQRGPRAYSGFIGSSPTAYANFTIARLRESQGDLPAALAAIRRRESDGFPSYLWSKPAFLRQEGRLAALVGDTTGARRAYDEYLVLRRNPDAPLRAQRDSVVAERAALDVSRRR
jgi:tRNA A-37 threonylcarbamoyl transferase component Bud32/tetratricopeptide (TPR) repeat protein